jgi:OPA family glycerol-3-phosphate transporter-like MFS transporter
MYLTLVALILAAVIVVYFLNNPLGHSSRFIWRRFVNWFPLGMTYGFLYMGRYNLNVAKNALGSLISNEQFGLIFGIGTLIYGLSFLVNGPLVDRIGGKKGIVIAAVGAGLANVALGILTYVEVHSGAHAHLVVAYSALYALNMYFQSYGAVSIIKVKAYWFHVRERGVFGAIFGTLISIGVYLAFDWSQKIVDWFPGRTWYVFFAPAAILAFWLVFDLWLIRDSPEEAGFPAFETYDASAGQMHLQFTAWDLVRKVFTSPLMLMVAVVEFTSGIFRNGVQQWYFIFARQVPQLGAEVFLQHWGFILCVTGICGGFGAGIVSDRLFRSRRGPPAAICCAIALFSAAGMYLAIPSSPVMVAVLGVLIVTCSIGITSLMSGTAATDFGGRKATATASGIVDGFAYLGSFVESVGIGYLTNGAHWKNWPLFFIPFAVLGLAVGIRIWNELPAATRKYIAEVEGPQQAQAVAA